LPFVAEPGSKTKLSKRKLDKYLKNPDFAQLMKHGRKVAEALRLATNPDTFNPVVVDFYEQVGYLPEAVLNYLALLGWSLDDKSEDFSRAQLIESFSLDRVNKAAASFDPAKLWAFQIRHMQRLPLAEKTALVVPYLQRAGLAPEPLPEELRRKVEQVVAAAGDRIKTAGDVLDFDYFFLPDEDFLLDQGTLKKQIPSHGDAELLRDCRELIRRYHGNLDALRRAFASQCYSPSDATPGAPTTLLDPEALLDAAERLEAGWVNEDAVERSFRGYVADNAIKMADVIHKVRVALTGTTTGLGVFAAMGILGRDHSALRIDRALREAGFGDLATPQISALPESLQEAVDFSDPGKPIKLFDGQLAIAYSDGSVVGPGKLELRLAPSPEIGFHLEPSSSWTSPWNTAHIGDAELRIPELDISVPALVTHSHVASGKGTWHLEGVPNGRVAIGGSRALHHVIFHLADFLDYSGAPVRDGAARRVWAGRLNLTAGGWAVTIDKTPDAAKRRATASEIGGTPITHVARLERVAAEAFSATDCGEMLGVLQQFLSFVRGQWVAPLISVGFDNHGARVWQDWTMWRVQSDPGFESWCPVRQMGNVQAMFPRFHERWMDPVWREIIGVAIGSYLQANQQRAVDDSIIAAQIVLESLAEFVLVEHGSAVGAASPAPRFAQKVVQLLARVGIPTEIPDPLKSLRDFAEAEHLDTGADAIMRIRNACVHPTMERRKFLDRLRSYQRAFYDASRLALWYTDLCLLWFLGFRGKYQSRVHAKFVGETEPVPWSQPLPYPLEPVANGG
jgi:hypothetical protein